MAAQTPMRPVPGAFFQTPAQANDPVRRQLFTDPPPPPPRFGEQPGTNSSGRPPMRSRYSSGGGQSQEHAGAPLPLPPVEPPNIPPITKGARTVNDLLQWDESYPDLDSYCRPGASSDYDLQFVDSAWAPFHKPTMYTFPDAVFQRFDHGQVTTKMGLFTEINHAWITIDSSLFLWDYTRPDPELIGFEDAPHTITGLHLVPPKPGVFVASITHILVVATASELILLGVSATSTPTGKTISLYQTKMTLSKGSIDVSVIAGSADGRIFFGGSNDTDIYELYYQQEEKWFSSRCGKINHTYPGWSSVMPNLPRPQSLWQQEAPEGLVDIVIDDSRKLLYTLSDKSTIRTYHMEGPEKLTKVIEKDKMSCLRDITHMISASQLLTDRMRIVSISPISSKEAAKLHLMALTDTGCRVFLSATSSAYYMMSSSSNSTPQSMQVQFVKFPPKDQPTQPRRSSGGANDPLDLHSRALEFSKSGKRFAPGYFFDFVAKTQQNGTDLCFVSAPETGRIKYTSTPASALRYYEHANWIDLGENVSVVAVGSTTEPFAAAGQPMGFGNELAVQFDQQASEFAIMTTTGIHIVRRRRLVDIFSSVIRSAAGEEGLEQEMRRFTSLYGRPETISAALAVACGQGNDTRAGTPRVIDQVTEDRAKAAFIAYGGQPSVTETDGAQVNRADGVKLSYRYDGMALYITRLVRSLWKSRVIIQGANPQGGIVVNSTVPMTKLNIVQENLDRLRNFLETNKGTIQGLSGPADLQHVSSRQEELAVQSEHQGLHSLQKLMESMSEGISFVLMLFDERVADIFVRLDAASQSALKDLTYEKLFSQESGKDLAKLLVKAIVNRNIESGSNVETVADALRRRCGSFCSPEDVVIFKAQEQLKRAAEQSANSNTLRQLLNESLRLFERVAGSLTFANLRGAVEAYLELKYYAGAIRLCLTVAREKDRGNSALAWIHDGKIANDPRSTAFAERKRCYDLVHGVLERLDAVSQVEPEMIDGKLTLSATKRQEAYAVVNDSDDEVFHFELYDWYIQQGWTDRILQTESPHVIPFLTRLAQQDTRHADLLCRFYTHRSRFFEAAGVQAELAASSLDIGIKDRITLLSRAKGNASVSTVGVSRQEQQMLNHQVTELLEVAHIQDDLLERLKADSRITDDRKADIEAELDGTVHDLTTLYNNYADQAGYYDLCLLIYHAADFHNPRTIADTWRNLIESEHTSIIGQQEAWEAAQQEALATGSQITVAAPAHPYEVVSLSVQEIAHRTSLDSIIFPVDTLLTLVCEYAITNQQDETIGADPAWPVMIFINLGVSDSLTTRVLERIFDSQEAPFTGRKRKVVVRWLNVVIENWMREIERRGVSAVGKGDTGLGTWVVDLIHRMDLAMADIVNQERNTRPANGDDATQQIARHTRILSARVGGAVATNERASHRFM